MDPGAIRYWLGGVLRNYEHTGKYEAALDLLEKHLPESDGGKARVARMRQAYAARGPAGYWQASLDYALSQAKTGAVDPVLLAFLYTKLGDRSRAIDYLERAYGEHNGDIPFITVQPGFDPLRGEPRFQALVRRISPQLLPGQRS